MNLPDDLQEDNLSEFDHEDNFEDWEPFVELHDKKDYPALVKYCEQRATKFPDDPYAQYYLGEAYVLNGEYKKAIQFISKLHKKYPENMDYQHVILDALFALGKNENDFNWTKKPIVLRMSNNILNFCYDFLKTKLKPRSIDDIYVKFIMQGYLHFTEEDLFEALRKDNRFIMNHADKWYTAEVEVTRKRERSKNISD